MALRVGTSVSHGKEERTVMSKVEILIGKLLAVNGFTACTVASCKVSSLQHELWYDSVEFRSRISESFLSGTKSTEVFDRLWDDVVEKFKIDASSLLLYMLASLEVITESYYSRFTAPVFVTSPF